MKDETLKDIDDNFIEAGRSMEAVAREPSKVKCLESFIKCKEIVEWLQRETRGYLLFACYSPFDQEYAYFECRCS